MIYKTPNCLHWISRRICLGTILLVVLFNFSDSNKLSAQSIDTLKIDSLRVVFEQKEGLAKMDVLQEIYDVYFPQDISKAKQIAEESTLLAKQMQSIEAEVIALESHAEIYAYQGNFDSMFILNKQVLSMVGDFENKKYLCSAYSNLGIYFERKGTIDSALHYNLLALEIVRDERKFITQNNLGRIYRRQGDINKSLEFYELGMNGAKKYGEKNVEAVISNNLGGLYDDINIKKEAKKLYLRSIDLKKEIGDKKGQLFALLNLSIMDGITLEEEKSYLDQGLAIAGEVESDQMLSIFISKIAENLGAEGKVDEGIEMVLPRYNLSKDSPSYEYPFIVGALASLYLDKGDFTKAEEYANELLELGVRSSALDYQQGARLLLKNIYEKQDNTDGYFQVAKIYHALEDSMKNQVNVNKFAYLEAALDDEQKAKVDLLNRSIKEKTKSRNQLAIIGLLLTLLLSSLLYFRNKLVKSQKKIIEREKESATILSEKNEILEAHDALKNRLYTNITHEFRTPLTIIHGVVQQLTRHEGVIRLSKGNDYILRQLDTIRKNGNNLLDMVNNILNLSKLEDNTLEIELIQGDMIQYIKYLSMSFESLVDENDLEFEIQSEEEEIIMDFDVEKIRQVFGNLISNAIKHTPAKGKITVNINKINLANSDLIIEVRDNGAGIPQEDLPFIFERFYQVSDTQNMAGGTGIGLAYCKELVSLLGGSIAVESELGEGTIFTVCLPISNEASTISKEDYSATMKNPSSLIKEQKDMFDIGFKPSVLIIEDNKDVANFVFSCLMDDYDCKIAKDGQEGIEKALEIIPDLIITDIMMPIKDGYEVCAFLKQNELTSHIPVVMLTAKSGQQSKLSGLETGADVYLIKPFDTKELELQVRNLIGSRELLRDYFTSSINLRTNPKKANTADKKFYEKVYNIIESNLSNEQFGVEYLAQECHISKAHLNRKIKATTDLSTNKFIQTVRLKHALVMLKKGNKNVSEIAYDTGFSSLAYFVKCFRAQYNVTPGSLLS